MISHMKISVFCCGNVDFCRNIPNVVRAIWNGVAEFLKCEVLNMAMLLDDSNSEQESELLKVSVKSDDKSL